MSAKHQIDKDTRYQKLVIEFTQANGRAPNDLDRMALLEQMKTDEMARIVDQIDQIHATVADILERIKIAFR